MNARSRALALRVYALLGTIVVIALMLSAIPRMVDAWEQYPWDGKVDWIAARAFVEGRNPYSLDALEKVKLDGLGHPPTTSFWWLPFTGFELMQVSPLLGHVVVFAILLLILMIACELEWPLPPLTAMIVFGLVMNSSWMLYHLRLAQVSGLVAFLYFMSWYLLRRGEEVAAGALLGFACTFKLFPGLLVVMLLYARRWRSVVAAVGAYLVIFVTMTSRFGLVSWPQYIATEKIITRYWIDNSHNASLFGIVRRQCRAVDLPGSLGTSAAVLLGGALITLGWWLTRRSLRERRFDLPFMLFAILSVFLNPFTFEHYFAILVLPLLVTTTAWTRAWQRGMPRRSWALTGGCLATAAAFLTFDYRWQDQFSWTTAYWTRQFLEDTNWLHMPLLIAACGILIRWRDRAGAAGLPAVAEFNGGRMPC
jgi:hypothetical protein